MNKLFLLVVGMTLVTYIPRMLPFLIFSKAKLPGFVKRFLKLIPFTALSALIFPGILESTSSIHSALLGGFVAFILSYFEWHIIFVILGSISSVVFLELFL